eukprot:9058240-Karenia_brevis.AAC.1
MAAGGAEPRCGHLRCSLQAAADMDMSEDMDMAAGGAKPRRDQFQRSDVEVRAGDMDMSVDVGMDMSEDMDMAAE